MLPKSRVRPQQPVHPPTSKIIVTQKHSYELVRTVITATISHILWARRVFPHVTYNFRTCDPADPEANYDHFITGSKNKALSFDSTEELLIWKVMPRSQDPAVDKLLDCLEIGAADALKKGYLSKLQLSFHSIDDAPPSGSNIIESYTMLFAYENGKNISVSTEIESGPMVLRTAKQQLYNLVNDVGYMVLHISRHRLEHKQLPKHFRMNMSLKYHEHTPPDYHPPMFRQGDENTLQILGLGVPDDKLTMDTGFHRICVGVNISESEDSALSNQLRTGLPSLRQRTISTSSDIYGAQTQPEAMKQIQTIGLVRGPNSETQDTVLLQKTPAARDTEILGSQDKIGIIEYTQQINNRIKAAHLLLPQNDFDLDDPQNTQAELNCECCASGDKEKLIRCAICWEFKHATCYAYINDYIPGGLACYTCLLLDDDPDRLEMIMKPLCIKRRALRYLQDKGSLSAKAQDDDFAAHLSIAPKVAAQLLNELKAEGYVKGHKKGKKSSTIPVYTYIGNDETLRQNYFRPQQGIDYLFTIPESHSLNDPQPGCEDDLPSNPPKSAIVASPDLYGASPLLTRKNINKAMESSPHTPVTPFPQMQRRTPEGSSTQGTPSPQQTKPMSSTTQKLIAMNSFNTEKFNPLKNRNISLSKRPASKEDVTTSFKRHKVGEVTPWVIRRRGAWD